MNEKENTNNYEIAIRIILNYINFHLDDDSDYNYEVYVDGRGYKRALRDIKQIIEQNLNKKNK